MKVYAYGQKSPDKKISQDCIMVGNSILSEGSIEWTPDAKSVLAIADGVGGNAAGDIASFTVMQGLRRAELYSGCIESYLRKSITNINQQLLSMSAENTQYNGMATTLSGVYMDTEKALLFHIGNTRVYTVNGGAYLRQLTTDHTNVQELVELGRLTKKEAFEDPRKNVINACMGGGNPELIGRLVVEDITSRISGKDLIITCDGIHDSVTSDDMEEILFGVDCPIGERLRLLAKKARDNGSVDDISIIYFKREE